MRLIDADYVLEVIKEVNDPTVATDVLDHIIATTPTAYDVNKVLKELEDSLYDTNTYGACDDLETIVKRGGVE